MKKYMLALVAVFVLAIACGGAETPDQVVTKLLNGVLNADGDAVVSCLSAEAVAGIDEMLVEIKADPEGTAAMAVMMGIEVTPEEVADITAGKALTLLLGSELVTAEIPDLAGFEVGAAVIDGETASVPVTVDGESNDVQLILEDGSWKIAGEGMDFM